MSHRGTAVNQKTQFQSRTKVNPSTSKGTKVVIRDAQVETQEYIGGVNITRKRDEAGKPVGQASSTPVASVGGGVRDRGGKSQQAPGQTMIRVLDRPGGTVVGQVLVQKNGQPQLLGGIAPDVPNPEAVQAIAAEAYDFTAWDTLDTDQKVMFLGTMSEASRLKFLAADKARKSPVRVVESDALAEAENRARGVATAVGKLSAAGPAGSGRPPLAPPAEGPAEGEDSFGPGEEDSGEIDDYTDLDTGKKVDPSKVIPPDYLGVDEG